MPRSTRPVEVSGDLLRLDPEGDPTWAWACELVVPASDVRSSEQWARAVFEGAPRLIRAAVVAGWVAGLRLRLAPLRSPDHVLGWDILAASPTVTTLGVEGRALGAHVVVRTRPGTVTHATFVRIGRRRGHLLWAVAGPVHRLIVPYLLRHAARVGGPGGR